MGEIRLHGRGGQGTVIAAEMLANAFVLGGKYASVFPSFGVERRGSAVMAFARYGDTPIREHTRVYRPDILLILDQSLTETRSCYDGFKHGGIIIANTKHKENIVGLNLNQRILATVDATQIAVEETGTAVTNTCMLGVFARATGLVRLEDLQEALSLYFKDNLLAKNLRAMARGFEELSVASFTPEKAAAANKKATAVEPTIAPPKDTTPFPAAWSDMDKKMITVQTGEWRYRRPELHKASCRLCGWCSVYCPAGCMKLGEDGYYHPDLTYCKGCGVCVNECPAQALKMTAEEAL